MDRITFFEGLRSLVEVAEDITEALVDKVNDLFTEIDEALVPQAPEAEPRALTREEKAWAIVQEWGRRNNHYGPSWNPTDPGFKAMPDYLIDEFYQYFLDGNLP